ncbi:hypothetical protein OPKNFCMD_3769 [Methylobacterium crusticola]|uniref:Uncharacterized protein n=1 Tax=Methylobacterium crusticola TaxID=1697972 RepID=A0ABQ4R0F1_9HYPH|nr:hypothetical protein [Methylobacterium crusticola]GJD51018.1 hypothetical protein OPKNFCMD_3769 [Methylobacterium crusticola]
MQLDEQVHRVLTASQQLAGQVALLGWAVQLAWLEWWTQPVVDAASAHAAWLSRQARRDRLVRRGVPDHLAREGLRIV